MSSSPVAPPEHRAGATDLEDRRRRRLPIGPVTDVVPTAANTSISWTEQGARIGALVRVQEVANDSSIRRRYPGLAAAAASLATPQVRAVATVGGALLQRSRCWYFRQPRFDCYKKGGVECPARDGDHRYSVLLDLGPCISPHPATLGVALTAYEASVVSVEGVRLTASQLYGDGSDPTCDHHLAAHDVLDGVLMPAPLAGEQAAYARAIARHAAEWPLVEVVVRLVFDAGTVVYAAVAAGAIANVPIRLPQVEAALTGKTMAQVEDAAAAVDSLPAPLATTAYKRPILRGTIKDALVLATAAFSPPAVSAPSLPWRLAQ